MAYDLPITISVVAPSLTPESYNFFMGSMDALEVVAPSLTPESYNVRRLSPARIIVVAPSLTPESYNGLVVVFA